MTTVYFVRHAEVDYNVHKDEIRPLTVKGKEDSDRKSWNSPKYNY